MSSAFNHWAYWSHMLPVLSMCSQCAQWVFGPLSPVTVLMTVLAVALAGALVVTLEDDRPVVQMSPEADPAASLAVGLVTVCELGSTADLVTILPTNPGPRVALAMCRKADPTTVLVPPIVD